MAKIPTIYLWWCLGGCFIIATPTLYLIGCASKLNQFMSDLHENTELTWLKPCDSKRCEEQKLETCGNMFYFWCISGMWFLTSQQYLNQGPPRIARWTPRWGRWESTEKLDLEILWVIEPLGSWWIAVNYQILPNLTTSICFAFWSLRCLMILMWTSR